MNIIPAIIISSLAAIITGGVTYYFKDRKYNNKWKYLSSGLRAVSIGIITFLLLAMNLQYTARDSKKPVIVWLQDNSESVGQGLRENLSDYETKKKGIIGQLSSDYDIEVYQFGDNITRVRESSYDAPVTHLDFAIQNTINRYLNENLGAVVVASDGIYNRGSAPAYSVSNPHNTHIYTVALGDSSLPKDISIQRIYTNKIVTAGNDFEVAFDVRFSQFMNSQHSIHLLQNGQIVRSMNHQITEHNTIISGSFVLTAGQPGIHHFQVQVPPAEGEATEVNNTFDFFVEFISNEIRVLVINNGAHPDIGFINNALRQAKGFKYDIAPPGTLPENFAQYDVLILHQPHLSAAQWKQISAAGIPAWHILGTHTHPLQLDMLTSAFSLRGSQVINSFQNISVSDQFHFFRLPLSAGDVIKKMPPLESRIQVFKAKTPAESYLKNAQSDVWAFSALQPIAVTVGEGIWKWGIYEQKDFKSSNITHELVQQTLHTLKKPQIDKTLNVFLNKRLLTDQEYIAISAELRNKNGQLINSPDVSLSVQGDNGYEDSFEFERIGNSYHKLIPPLSAGEYTYHSETILEGKKHIDTGQFIIENIPLEQMNTQADYRVMYSLAAQHGGQMYTLDDMQNLVDEIRNNEAIKSIIKSEPVNNPWIDYKWIFFLVMALLTAEWFIRKYFTMQ